MPGAIFHMAYEQTSRGRLTVPTGPRPEIKLYDYGGKIIAYPDCCAHHAGERRCEGALGKAPKLK
jgi:hypothetical protein